MKLPKEPQRTVRRTLADGSVKEYTYDKKRKANSLDASKTVGGLLAAYKMSPEWTNLKAITKYNDNLYIKEIERYADYSPDDIDRKFIISLRNGYSQKGHPAAANKVVQVIRKILNWAVENDWLKTHQVVRIKRLPGGHLPAWTREEADLAVAKLKEPLRRVVLLARYTGQRRGDLVKMLWSDYSGQAIKVLQQKGEGKKERTPLIIPVHPALKAELDAWKREAKSVFILTGFRGRPWRARTLSNMMGRHLPTIGLSDDLNNHGLRKLAATELADAGCTAHEIAAVTGHTTLSMVQLYTKAADQERLASAAIIRLHADRPFPETKIGKAESS